MRTESTSTDRVEQSDRGEVHRTTTETRELDHDGTVTVERTETTETTPVAVE